MQLMYDDKFREIDLNLLIVFSTVMRERSTTTAAQCLCISQSAVSQSLRRLRKITNDQLFLRDRRGVIPTPRALALYADLTPALISIGAAFDKMDEFDPKTSRRAFRIRVVSLQGTTMMPEIARLIHECAPRVQLEVTVRGTYEMARTMLTNTLCVLDRHEIDLIIGPHIGPLQTWHRKLDFKPVPMMCLYDGERLKLESPIALEEYVSLPQVVPYFAIHAKTIIDDGLAAIGHERKHYLLTDDHTSIPFYLKRTNAVANFPLHAAQAFASTYGLTLSPLPFRTMPYEMSLVWHVKDDADPGHRWLRDVITGVAGELESQ